MFHRARLLISLVLALGLFLTLVPARGAVFAASAKPKTPPAPPPAPVAIGAHFSAAPAIVDVGDQVILTLTASHFTPGATVIARFLSPHHGFSGTMPWSARCGCFRIAVFLAKRIHPLETATATAVITAGRATSSSATTFQVRGLAPNGRDFAPGGPAIFSTWVGDPNPVATEFQHYCAWARTSDALGVTGLQVRFVIHFGKHTDSVTAGVTGATGVVCLRRSVGHPRVGKKVVVDAYAGTLHAQTSFTPRA